MATNESSRPEPATRLWLLLLFVLSVPSALVRAEVLPVKTYTTADGMLRDAAYFIVQDSRGFLWFCTSDGLSRFDGYGFTMVKVFITSGEYRNRFRP